MTTPTITAFESSPDRGRGLARDMRVRWALEEVGQPYDVRLVSFAAMKEPAHLALHPFGQIPTYEEGDLALFESGAIVLHIAERHAGPAAGRRQRPGARDHLDVRRAEHGGAADPRARDGRCCWSGDKPWYARAPAHAGRPRPRRGWRSLSARLGDADWLDGGFSAGRPDDGARCCGGWPARACWRTIRTSSAYVARGRGAAGLPAGVRRAAGGVREPEQGESCDEESRPL